MLYRDSFTEFARDCLTIRTKTGDLAPLALNKAQRYLHECLEKQRQETGKVRAIILKGRQQGCSTYVEARFYWRTIHRFGVRSFILAHEKDSTNAIYEMAKRYHENCPPAIKPNTGASNAKELVFDKLDSGYRIGTAGNDTVGRGTTLQYFHGSEVAFWPARGEASIATGVLQAVGDVADTEIILESTANGEGGFFHSETMKALKGDGDYQLVFIPWFWQEEYRRPQPIDFVPNGAERALIAQYGLDNEQLMWRRNKIIELSTGAMDGDKAFMQEYPGNVQEAFQVTNTDGIILPEWFDACIDAHITLGFEPLGQERVAYDPADTGDEKAVAYSHGSVILDVQGTTVGRIDSATDWATTYAIERRPDVFTWDSDGMGAGLLSQITQALTGKKIEIEAFRGSEAADNPERLYQRTDSNVKESKTNRETFINKRAQYYWILRDRMYRTYMAVEKGERTVSPDDLISFSSNIAEMGALRAELCRIPRKYNNSGRIQLMSKPDMLKQGIDSPNRADAVMMLMRQVDVVSKPIKIKFKGWS